jgi:hypothetical protein
MGARRRERLQYDDDALVWYAAPDQGWHLLEHVCYCDL